MAVAALGTEPKADLVDQGGGMQDAETVDNGNVALYSVFAVVGFFGGTVCNRLGTRLCLFVGSLGYGIYMSSLYATTQTTGESAQHYVVAAGYASLPPSRYPGSCLARPFWVSALC